MEQQTEQEEMQSGLAVEPGPVPEPDNVSPPAGDARSRRMQTIAELERLRDSRVLVYLTGDRRGMETQIAGDAFPRFHQHLMRMGPQPRIDLFLYTPGGRTTAGFALANLIREFCDEFHVIVPFRALSTGTLICLGANSIVMTRMAQLSPIDPSVGHALGPVVQLPGQPAGQRASVSVEDVIAYIDLARNEVGLAGEDALAGVFARLSECIHPLVLGAVHRSREQIAFLASHLMAHHCSSREEIERVTSALIRERFSHSYIIGRREARDGLGLNVVEPDTELAEIVIGLFSMYSSIMELDMPYNPETVLGNDQDGVYSFDRGMIESRGLTQVFRTKKQITRVQVPTPNAPVPVVGYQQRVLAEGWMEDDGI